MDTFSQNKLGKVLPLVFFLLGTVGIGLLITNMSLNIFLGVLGLIIIFIAALINIEKFTVVLLFFKPLIDLTWNSYFTSFGGMSVNSLRVVGVFVFVIWGIVYLKFILEKKRDYVIFNHNIFLMFLLCNLISFLYGFLYIGNRSIITYFDVLIRIADGALLYFIAGYLFINSDKRRQLLKVIWISTLLPLFFSYYSYFSGSFNVSISTGVERFAGLYDDAGVAAVNSMAGIIFAILYYELYLRNAVKRNLYRMLIAITVLSHLFIMYLTLSRAIAVVFFVFVLLWFGIYKKKILWVVPLLIVLGFAAVALNPSYQTRFQKELTIIQDDGLSLESIRGFGSGRGFKWFTAIEYYKSLNVFEKIIGRGLVPAYAGSHQDYLDILNRNGMIGLILYVILMIGFLLKTLKNSLITKDIEFKPLLFFAFIMVLNHLIYGISFRPLMYTTYTWYLWLILGITLNHKQIRMKPQPDYSSAPEDKFLGQSIEH